MKFGLADEQFRILHEMVIQPLKVRNAKVYAFGSRVTGRHHPFSDIDLLYKEDPRFPISASELARIKENVENSNLTIKVDLVNDADLAASYRQSVENAIVQI